MPSARSRDGAEAMAEDLERRQGGKTNLGVLNGTSRVVRRNRRKVEVLRMQIVAEGDDARASKRKALQWGSVL